MKYGYLAIVPEAAYTIEKRTAIVVVRSINEAHYFETNSHIIDDKYIYISPNEARKYRKTYHDCVVPNEGFYDIESGIYICHIAEKTINESVKRFKKIISKQFELWKQENTKRYGEYIKAYRKAIKTNNYYIL